MTCEKCGFEYTGDSCPVCAVQATNEAIVISEKKTSGLGIAGMILGIVSLAMFVLSGLQKVVLMFYMPFITIPGYVIGIIPSIVGLVLCSKAKKANSGDKLAKVGKIFCIISMILKIVGLVIAIVFTAIFIVLMLLGVGTSVITSIVPRATYY